MRILIKQNHALCIAIGQNGLHGENVQVEHTAERENVPLMWLCPEVLFHVKAYSMQMSTKKNPALVNIYKYMFYKIEMFKI